MPVHQKSPSSTPIILFFLVCAGAGIGGFFWLAKAKDSSGSTQAGCVDTVHDLSASSVTTETTIQCSPQQIVQVTVTPDGHRVITCRCRRQGE